MKIDGYQAGKLYESFQAKANTPPVNKTDDSPKKDSADRVEISSKASDMNEATALGRKTVSAETPVERQERIDQIKKMIDAGTYNVPAKTVAQSILLGRNLDIRA